MIVLKMEEPKKASDAAAGLTIATMLVGAAISFTIFMNYLDSAFCYEIIDRTKVGNYEYVSRIGRGGITGRLLWENRIGDEEIEEE